MAMAAVLALAFATPARADDAPAAPVAGTPAPVLLGKNRDNDDVDRSAYRGKVVIVTFWASWCG